jgi:glycolate oxidase
VEAEWARLEAIINASSSYQVKIARNEDERLKIWKGRKSAFSAVGRLSPDYIVQDGVVPRSTLGEALKEIEAISLRHGLRVANVFHAGDGNLHPLILFNSKIEGEFHRAELVSSDIIDLCIRLGGSITGEHGVGVEKRDYMPRQFDETDMDAMWRMRMSIDPLDIANRGKVFPTGEAPALRHVGMHPLEKSGVISRE